jgi:hypothetical protein
MSTLKVNTIQNASGVEKYLCQAWVNFNGTGTVAIRASGNVSSITDNGTGDYTVNFATAMPDANYAVASFGDGDGGGGIRVVCGKGTPTASARQLDCRNAANTLTDFAQVNVAFFR